MHAQTVNDGVLTDCYGVSGEYHIDAGVREIGPYAFMLSSVTKIYVPASVQKIDLCAFSMAPELTAVEFEEGSQLTSIEDQAFEDCAKLEKIHIPNSVVSIGKSAFTFCTALKDVLLPQNLQKLDYGTFSTCSSLTNIEIPQNCKVIGEFAFANCTSLNSISVSGTDSIGKKAFYHCATLSDVNLGEGLKFIGDSVFARCGALKRLLLPASLDSVGVRLTLHCPSFTGFDVAAGNASMMSEDGILYSKDKGMLYECPQTYSSDFFVVSPATRKINAMAFFECYNVKGIKIPGTIEGIGEASLSCNGMTHFDFAGTERYKVDGTAIYAKLKSTEGYALLAVPCKGSTTDFTLLPGTAYIAKYVFANNEAVQNVTMPDALLGLGDFAFYGCHGLKNLYSYAMEGPTLGEEVFSDIAIPNVLLHVKEGAASSYQLADWPFAYGDDVVGEYPNVTDGIGEVAIGTGDIHISKMGNSISVKAPVAVKKVEYFSFAGQRLAVFEKLDLADVVLAAPVASGFIVKVTLQNGMAKAIKVL